jgi:hypothetical protein
VAGRSNKIRTDGIDHAFPKAMPVILTTDEERDVWMRRASASGSGNGHVAKNNHRRGLGLDQLSFGLSRKRMSVLAMVPRSGVMTAMSTTCSDLGRS